ncbi:MAG: phosphatase PAP2 family protein [Sedimentisphaerales bacterium]
MKIEDLKFKIFSFIFLFNFASFMFAAEPNDVNDVNIPVRATGNFRLDAKAFPKVAFDDAKKTYFNSHNLMLILLAGGGSIALHDSHADSKIANNFEDHRSIPKTLDNITDIAGNPGTHFAATGIWYLMAAHNKDDLNVQRSWIMMRALAVTGATTLMLKGIVHNDSPNGAALAWPSGHTASSFCVASVLDEFYGPKVGIPAYLLAGFVGYRMMDSGDHWASDVLFGGVLGYVVGHAVAGENKKLEVAGFEILPLISPERNGTTTGIVLAKEF